METKRCSMCKEIIPLSYFGAHSKTTDGLQTACRQCKNAHSKKANKTRIRKQQPSSVRREQCLNYRYGLSIQKYNELFKQQEGCCAICKVHQSKLAKALHVDHEHSVGFIRGLLCFSCNIRVGMYEADTLTIKNEMYLPTQQYVLNEGVANGY